MYKRLSAEILSFIIICTISIPASAETIQYPEIHCKHYIHGIPVGTPSTNDLIIRDIYAMSCNDKAKFADWVAYRLDKSMIAGDARTARRWEADPLLADNETLEPEDYKGMNKALKTNLGYQAPSESFKGTKYRYQTNYLSNITPQKTALNQGPWKRLESKVRRFVEAGNVLYVTTGPLYEKSMQDMPAADEIHTVPSGYWKVIIHQPNLKDPKTLKVAAYIFPQNTLRFAKVKDHCVTVDEVEKRSGLDLLWELTDDIEFHIESFRGDGWL
jgi:endonuclease G